MNKVITNQLVRSLTPKEKPYEIRDTQLKGLILRVQRSGIMTYYMVYKRGKRYKLGRADAITPQQARELGRKIMAEVYNDEDPVAKRKEKNYTLEAFLDDEYKTWAKANIRTADATLKRMKASFKQFLNSNLSEITPLMVEKWRAERVEDGIKHTTINRELTDLKSVLAKAVYWEIIKEHPLSKVKRSKEDSNLKPRYLTPEEEKNLREALLAREAEKREDRARFNKWRAQRKIPLLPDYSNVRFVDDIQPIILLAMNTGMRRGELFNLKWEDVDLKGANLTVVGQGAKSGKTRHIPLDGEALDVLKAWREQSPKDAVLVFPSKDGKPFDNIKKSWAKLLKKANITGFRFHDLRHHFASCLVMEGVDLNMVRELLGHRDYKMTLRYAYLAPKHKHDAVKKLDRRRKRLKAQKGVN